MSLRSTETRRSTTTSSDTLSTMAEERSYRMLVLLEDKVEDSTAGATVIENSEASQTPNATHEFVDELILPFEIEDMDKLNRWFDKFDADICIPNEGFIKYEISSDGLVVLLLDRSKEDVVSQVREFVESTKIEYSDDDDESS
ncbi:LANO_0F13938g1_1 [Lachancea nothofagi CBS 11611]|uniref:LANO_0F13938g1_1 n=1 Tax=Lachancea nothofagi CBS 11611 TaxID=1266666 RepID=A0A1G4KC16_9SACH|nr:LANO_0F13938g1_1 [Lachancea nothofagi CBS 11611]